MITSLISLSRLEPLKDLLDLAQIISHYEYVGQDSLFDQHYDLLTDSTLDSTSPQFMLQVSARLLGRHMQKITRRSQPIHERITNLLSTEKEAADESRLVQAWSTVNRCTLSEARDILNRLFFGLEDPLPKDQ